MDNGFMVKFGKKEHLQQIINGTIRFAPAQTYIEIEKNQQNKGQGDLLEGKWVVHAENMVMESLETGQEIAFPTKTKLVVGSADVNNMPVFCLSFYDEKNIYDLDGETKIILPPDKLECIDRDFPEATHALIILEKEKFINEILGIENHNIVSDKIHYYDYDINDIRMVSFLTTGDEMAYLDNRMVMSMNYEERYRHLLCKDNCLNEKLKSRKIEKMCSKRLV